jgi:hypothetical protein
MTPKLNPASFSPFLEAMRTNSASKNEGRDAGSGAFELLRILANAPEKRMEVSAFLKRSGLGLDAFQRALQGFEAANLCYLQRPNGGPEEVALTPAGEQIAGLRI